MSDQLLETWRISDRLNRYLLEAIQEDQFETPLAKGKKVASQFAHIHSVRLMWLKASAPDLMENLTKIEDSATKEEIGAALQQSGGAVELLLSRSCGSGGKIKNFKPHVTAFLGYLIAHEAHHRSQVEIALRQAGTPLPEKIAYGIWEWGSR